MGTSWTIRAAQQALTNPLTGRQWPGLALLLKVVDPSLRRRIAAGALWSIAGAGFASGLTMLSNIFSARFLGSTQYGELAIVLATVNLFTALFTSGLSMTATRYVAEHRNSDPQRAGVVVGLSSATAMVVGISTTLLILALAPWLSRAVLDAAGLSGALRLGGVVLLFAAINGAQTGALSGLEAFNLVAIGNLIRGAGIVILVTLGAALGGVSGALYGYIAVGALIAVYYQIVVRRECAAKAITISYRFGRDDFSILWRFTLPVLLTTLSFTPASWWGNVLLARTSGYAEVGVFNAAFHWQMFIQFFSGAVSNIGLPMLSNIRSERDPAKYKRCLATNFLLVTAPAVAIAIPVMIGARFILGLYGPAFEHGWLALVLISISAVLTAMNIPVGQAIWSLDATVPAVLLALLRGGVLVIAAYAMSSKGAAGLAGAYVIMGVIQTVVSIPFMMRLLRRGFERDMTPAEVAS